MVVVGVFDVCAGVVVPVSVVFVVIVDVLEVVVVGGSFFVVPKFAGNFIHY